VAQIVNDVHSRLNSTTVIEIVRPTGIDAVRETVLRAGRKDEPTGGGLAVCGGRHAMGGQQFDSGRLLLDMSDMNKPIALDEERGLLTIEAGAMWPDVIRATRELSRGDQRFAIRQKQTGADTLTIGGAVACNAHGRGLVMGPISEDIESLTLVDAAGDVVECSRDHNSELFSLVIGGYGLFGVVVRVTLRLWPRRKMRRLVDIIDIDDAVSALRRRVAEGCVYGDFQYAIDASDESFMRRGVMSCYKPAPDDAAVHDAEENLSKGDWLRLLELAYRDKSAAFSKYAQYYLSTHGRVYWSDTMQLSTYIPDYSEFLASRGLVSDGSEESLVIGEQFVPPGRLVEFLERARTVLRETGAEVIYGTIRTIHRDETSFLRWARAEFSCVIFNLRTPHTEVGIERTHETFRKLNDASLDLGGGFYLTYHRAATASQVVRAYPRIRDFLTMKERYDPPGVFQSDWYRHYRRLLAEHEDVS
jgi:FAD/FMN-containing dehydrogenase